MLHTVPVVIQHQYNTVSLSSTLRSLSGTSGSPSADMQPLGSPVVLQPEIPATAVPSSIIEAVFGGVSVSVLPAAMFTSRGPTAPLAWHRDEYKALRRPMIAKMQVILPGAGTARDTPSACPLTCAASTCSPLVTVLASCSLKAWRSRTNERCSMAQFLLYVAGGICTLPLPATLSRALSCFRPRTSRSLRSNSA